MKLRTKSFIQVALLVSVTFFIVSYFSLESTEKIIFDSKKISKEILNVEENSYDALSNRLYEEYKKSREELIKKTLIVMMVVVVILYYIFIAFLDREILSPLRRLQNAMHAALEKRFEPIEVKRDDEIGEILNDSNRLFEKFWEGYFSLESYKNSVDKANLVTKTDLKGNITYANDLFCKTSGYSLEEIIGKPHNIVRHEDMPSRAFKELWDTIKSGSSWRGVVKNKTKDDGYYWVDAVISPVVKPDGSTIEYISIRRDVTELMESKEQLEFSANYDLLTNLGSRNRLHRDLEQGRDHYLAIINIDRFSQINDFYGHDFGDRLLKIFSHKLENKAKDIFGDNVRVYRSGGDEFALLIYNLNKDNCIDNIKQLLDEIAKTSYILDDKNLHLNFSCGISFENNSNLLLSADMALRLSKIEKKEFVVYTKENSLNEKYKNNIEWAKKLKSAIKDDRIVLFFQPIVNNQTLKYDKFEALIRMIDDDGNVVAPFFFLDIAKQTKQYLELTKIVINKSFEAFKDKNEEFSINLTMEDITNEEISKFIYEKLDKNGSLANRVVFEIVESESISDYKYVNEFINNIKSYGSKIAIDDFGSGYSNFEYLIKLQADYIKIDGSLVKNIAKSRESFVVVSTIVSFAKEMNIKTIAEFIENEEILEVTKEIGIDYSQGYYFSPPKRLEEF